MFVFHLDVYEDDQQVSSSSRRLLQKIQQRIAPRLNSLFGRYYISGMNVWSFKDIEAGDSTIITSVDNIEYRVRLKLTRKAKMRDLMTCEDDKLQVQQILNVVVKAYLKKKGYEDIGVNQRYYKSSEMFKNGKNGLKVMEGFHTSVHIVNKKPFLMIDVVCRVLRNETLHEVMFSCKDKEIMRERVRAHQVITIYGTNRIYKVLDVDFNLCPTSKMNDTSTFAEYYQKTYGITIKDLE